MKAAGRGHLTFRVLVLTILVVGLLFSGVRVARVDGSSMAPTLIDQDRLIVDVQAYKVDRPRVGDIVMVRYPRDPKRVVVKRVIAAEGDNVRISGGTVFVNDRAIPDDYVPPEFRSGDDWGPQAVRPGFYFVLGDHRNRSSDSRHWGAVARDQILGKIKFRWWPLSDLRMF